MSILKCRTIKFLLLFFFSLTLEAQETSSSDSTYYENWVGTWYQVNDNEVAKKPSFVVRRGLYKSSFEEYWMNAGGDFSVAWRAWDKRSEQWDFAWMSPEGWFQLWEGKKVNGIWYMYRTFTIDDEKVLSRQAFTPIGKNELLRTSEHSKDGGKTWSLRFKEKYIKTR